MYISLRFPRVIILRKFAIEGMHLTWYTSNNLELYLYSKYFWYRVFVKLVSCIINFGYKDASSTYDDANKEILEAYKRNHIPDGELNFFAVDPSIMGKGLGTLLLNELKRREKGKHIYLFTDSGSTYQFYSSRGFDEVGRKEISLGINNKEVPLICLLFSRKL